jgi:hypothetical protein
MSPASSLLRGNLADNSQQVIRRPTGADQVLTFFDYLRQRAFESVLAGAQEALELLECQKSRNEPEAEESRLPTPALASQAGPSAKQAENQSLQENPPVEDDQPLPVPRRRGRPDEKPKGK